MTSLSLSEARATLPALLDRVSSGEEVTITRHGRPVAVVVRPDALRRRRAESAFALADRIGNDLAAPSRSPSQPLDNAAYADELVAQVRRGRNRH